MFLLQQGGSQKAVGFIHLELASILPKAVRYNYSTVLELSFLGFQSLGKHVL